MLAVLAMCLAISRFLRNLLSLYPEHLSDENCLVWALDSMKNVKHASCISNIISSFEYNDFPHVVLPLVSWKPSPSPRKACA